MMGALREWLTSIAVVTMLLSVAQAMIPAGNIRRIASFTGGLILLAALLQPVLGTNPSRLNLHLEDYEEAIAKRQEELAKSSGSQLEGIIVRRTAAYISDKADTLGLAAKVQVKTKTGEDGVPVPAAVEIQGPKSEELASYIEEELGIPRERQVWHEVEN